jgi:hypothetical protein
LAWNVLRPQLELPAEISRLPKEQRQQVRNAIRFVAAVEDIKVIEK